MFKCRKFYDIFVVGKQIFNKFADYVIVPIIINYTYLCHLLINNNDFFNLEYGGVE